MAAIMGSYQPEGLNFSQHYPTSVPDSSYGRENRFDPEDEVVRSKPSSRSNLDSYTPLVNDNPHRKDWRERQEVSSEGIARQSDSSQMTPSTANHHPQASLFSIGSTNTTSKDRVPPQTSATALNLTEAGRLPSNASEGVLDTRDIEVPNSKNDDEEELIKVDLSVNLQPSQHLREASTPLTESENEQDQESIHGGSTTALLGDYQEVRRNRRVPQSSQSSAVPLGLPGDVLCSSGGLVEVLVVGHKKCSVTLEEESINWQVLSRQSGECRGDGRPEKGRTCVRACCLCVCV